MSIIKLSKQIADPRIAGRTVHKMEHIIYITIAAVIAGAQSWNEIAEFGKSKLDFFKKRLEGLETIPSHDTFNRFFSIFDPKGFEEIFRNWVREIVGEVKGVVAIDGKLMRGASKCDKAGWDEDYLSKLLERSLTYYSLIVDFSHSRTVFFACSCLFCAIEPFMASPFSTVAPLQASAIYCSVLSSPLPSWVQKGITVLPCQ